jgi:L-alanine-DL-glutamate epimerase-like enolase superfamily enzyme
MKIVSAETSVVEIPFKLRGSGVGIMPTAWKSLEFALVRLVDEQGNVGWGEGFGYFTVDATKAIVDRLILPTLVGTEVDDIPAWNLQTQRRIHMFGRYGITIFAIGGVDMALWDLKAKRAGVPLWQLLGPATPRASVPFYASLVRYADTALAVQSCEEVLRAGFTAIKLHEIGLPEITACRAAVGAATALCVDVNCAWSPEFVARHRAELEALQLTWLEEPVFPPEDFAALAALRGGALKIAAGENWCTARQFGAAFAAGAVDIVQPSVTKLGGISEFLAVLGRAEAAGVTVMPHSPYFGPGFFASLHLAAARPAIRALEYNFVQPDAWLADVETLRRGGDFSIPGKPGLGFEPDPAVLHRYRRA